MAIAFACVLAFLALAVSADPMRLKLLSNTASNGAICLDGTPGGNVRGFCAFGLCHFDIVIEQATTLPRALAAEPRAGSFSFKAGVGNLFLCLVISC